MQIKNAWSAASFGSIRYQSRTRHEDYDYTDSHHSSDDREGDQRTSEVVQERDKDWANSPGKATRGIEPASHCTLQEGKRRKEEMRVILHLPILLIVVPPLLPFPLPYLGEGSHDLGEYGVAHCIGCGVASGH